MKEKEEWTQEQVRELADVLRDQGQLQPVSVRRDGKGWLVIAGLRRCLAAMLLGWTAIEARDVSTGKKFKLAFEKITNVPPKGLQ